MQSIIRLLHTLPKCVSYLAPSLSSERESIGSVASAKLVPLSPIPAFLYHRRPSHHLDSSSYSLHPTSWISNDTHLWKDLTILHSDYKECSDYTKKKWNFKLELSILNDRQTNTRTAGVAWKCWKLPNGHTQLGKILGLKNYHFLKGFSPVLLSSFDSTQDLIQVCYLWTQNCTYFTEGTNMLPSSMECISESSGSSPPDVATTWPQTQQRKQRVTN
jgi:hypothetical protein